MNFKELCEARYSVRAYKQDPIPTDKLEYIKECARLAPSAVNFQPWRLRMITDPETLQKICTTYRRDWLQQAPTIIVVSAVKEEAWTRKIDNKWHGDIDAAIITEHICLAATEQGLGTCWVCNFDTELCHQLLKLPENEVCEVLIPIGYSEGETSPKVRKTMNEIWL